MNSISALKKKLDLIGKLKVKNVLLVQPIQVSEKKLDIKISLNKRYYMYPPYALGILNAILKILRKNKKETRNDKSIVDPIVWFPCILVAT